MKTLLDTPLTQDFSSDEVPVCDVLILYQDLATGKRAMEVVQHLTQLVGRECLFRCRLWNFGVLQFPQMHREIAGHAVKADVVLFAVHRDSDLPVETKVWIEWWIGKRARRRGALVALLSESASEVIGCASVRSYLQDVARRGQMEFFEHHGELDPNHQDRLPHTFPQRCIQPVTSLQDRLRNTQIYSRGGLNE